MLDGWYCRSIANKQAEDEAAARGAQRNAPASNDDYSSESSQSEPEQINYKAQYTALKKKLKYLIYENEYYQDSLRSSQNRLLKACRDRSFLLDRLLQYEKPENTSTDSDDSESSDDGEANKLEIIKKRRTEPPPGVHGGGSNSLAFNKSQNISPKARKRPPPQRKLIQHALPPYQATNAKSSGLTSDGHMTPEEVERHLRSRQSFLELVPERAPPTVPTEMFSNDPSLDSESNDAPEVSPHAVVEEWAE